MTTIPRYFVLAAFVGGLSGLEEAPGQTGRTTSVPQGERGGFGQTLGDFQSQGGPGGSRSSQRGIGQSGFGARQGGFSRGAARFGTPALVGNVGSN